MIHELQEFDKPFECDEFIASHACSSCWGMLIRAHEQRDEKKVFVPLCENCGEKTPGYVTKKYVARRIEINRGEAVEARYALRDALPWMKSKMNQEQLLKSLGF